MKRPKFLTIWLVLMALSSLYSLYTYTLGSASITSYLRNFPAWALGLFALLSITNIVAIWLLWTWKKIGLYVFFATGMIAASLNGMILGAIGVGTSIFSIIGVVILYLAMRPVWQAFK